jgi:hypothetical protein
VCWIGLAKIRDKWRALVNTLMNLHVPLNAGKLWSDCKTGGFSSRACFTELDLVIVWGDWRAM